MAGIALRGCRHVIGRLSQRVDRNVRTAMTGGTVTRRQRPSCARVAHNRRFERRVVFVTRIALRRRRNMRCGFEYSRRTSSNVTARTIPRRSARMSKARTCPYGS